MKVVAAIILTLLSLVFGILGLIWTGLSAAISELDDVRIIQFFGLPSIFISSCLASLVVAIGYRKLFWIIGPINTLSVIGALLGGYSGIIDLLTLQNKPYFGHQENNYYSIDLFIIAVLPILFVGFSWVVYFLIRSPNSIKKHITN